MVLLFEDARKLEKAMGPEAAGVIVKFFETHFITSAKTWPSRLIWS